MTLHSDSACAAEGSKGSSQPSSVHQTPTHPCRTFVVAGVSGCGKSTVGKALASRLGVAFFDGDDFHSPTNKEKMSSGQPLSDEDRRPWLASLADAIHRESSTCSGFGRSAVFACSALKQRYRNVLATSATSGGSMQVLFVVLMPPLEVLKERIEARWKEGKHFMPPSQLQAQLDDLDIDAEVPPAAIKATDDRKQGSSAQSVDVIADAVPLLVLRDVAPPERLVDTILRWSSLVGDADSVSTRS